MNGVDHVFSRITAGCKRIAIVGLAKNAGKTTVLNALIRWGSNRGFTLGLASIGRDGEDTDLLTLKKKPRITIPQGSYCITTDRIAREKPGLILHSSLGIPGVLGTPGIYRANTTDQPTELVGINTVQAMGKALKQLENICDLIVVDGALDRRSFALPRLVDGVILATGGAVGNSLDLICIRTMNQVRLISLPRGTTSHFIQGALTDRKVIDLLYQSTPGLETIGVQDWTKIFISPKILHLLDTRTIGLRVRESVRLLGISTNPFNPYGSSFHPEELQRSLKTALQSQNISVPILDVESDITMV